jgi:hypothetical protein
MHCTDLIKAPPMINLRTPKKHRRGFVPYSVGAGKCHTLCVITALLYSPERHFVKYHTVVSGANSTLAYNFLVK